MGCASSRGISDGAASGSYPLSPMNTENTDTDSSAAGQRTRPSQAARSGVLANLPQQGSAPSRRAVPGALTGLFHMPEMTQSIGGHLDVRSRVALAGTSRQIRSQIQPERQAGVIITQDVPRVRTSADVSALTERIQQELPVPFQGEPLAALGARIFQLPNNERQASMTVFLPVVRSYQGPRPALLDTMVRAADNPGGPRAAVMGQARWMVETGRGSAQQVADQSGITHSLGRADLQAIETRNANNGGPRADAAVMGQARWMVETGRGSAQQVADQSGITHPLDRALLRTLQADVANR